MAKTVISAVCVGLMLSANFTPAVAQVSFPSHPSSMAQCEAASARGTALYMEHSRLQDMYSEQAREIGRQLTGSCKGRDNWHDCAEHYQRQQKPLYEKASYHYGEYVRLKGEVMRQNNACRSTARVNERQERLAEDNERRNRQRYQENQRREHAVELDEQQRRHERERDRQPRVITESAPEHHDNRNEPRAVYTPQMRESQAQQQYQSGLLQRQQEARALRNIAGTLVQALRVNRSDATGVMQNAAAMGETHTALNAARGGSPVAGVIGAAGIADAGRRGGEALSSFDQLMQAYAPGSAGVSADTVTPARTGSAVSPTPFDVAQGPSSPEEACGKKVPPERNQCFARECEKLNFRDHAQCEVFRESGVLRD